MFEESFRRNANRYCVRKGNVRWTYDETIAQGRRLISGLPRERSLVMVRCSLTPETIAAYCALLEQGHVPLLVEAALAEELVSRFISLYRPVALLDPANGESVATGHPSSLPLHPALCLLLTTSGSTGSPKLVRLSKAGLRANAESIASYLKLDNDERPYLHLPISYSYGLSIINSHLLLGAEVCLASHTVMEAGYWEELRSFAATSFSGVPFHYQVIRRLGEAKIDVPTLRTLTQAGGRLDPRIVQYFGDWAERTGRRFFVMYGQTEAGPRITYLPPQLTKTAADSIGVPIEGVRVELIDENGAAVPDGTSGEMVVYGPSVMLGYANSAKDLADGDVCCGRLATGDLACRGPDGLLRITGRSSRLLKIYGLRINLDEVERQLGDYGYRAICFGVDDKLNVLLLDAVEPAPLRKLITNLFALPPRGVEVRWGATIATTSSGKLPAAMLNTLWEAAKK